MVIQHNIPALNAQGFVNKSVAGVKKSSEKLSSGYRINRAGDDAAGLAVSEKMRQQIRGIKQAIKNCQDGSALIQTFEGALDETVSIIHRMKGLAVEAANGEYSNEIDRKAIQIEYQQLCDEVDHIADTDFNGIVMLSGKPGVDTLALEKVVNSQDIAEMVMKRSAASEGAAGLYQAAQIKAVTFSARESSVKCGDLTVTGGTYGTDFKYENNTLTILSAEPITISGTSRKDHIYVEKDVTAFVTLNNLDIQFSDGNSTQNGTCAFKIANNSIGNVNITLSGTNTLRSGFGNAGLQKNGTGNNIGKLTIDGDGTLTTLGGGHGAGIGSGGPSAYCSNITINGGTIHAYGGARSATGCGAGIGSGCNGEAKDITITGGSILAVGAPYAGAGIGGGICGIQSEGRSKNIVISGGLVVAIGGSGGGYGGGAGIGGGGYFHGGASDGITISGDDTIVIAKGGANRNGQFADDLGGGIGRGDDIGQNDGFQMLDSLKDEPYSGTMFGVSITDGTIIHGNGKTPASPPEPPIPPFFPGQPDPDPDPDPDPNPDPDPDPDPAPDPDPDPIPPEPTPPDPSPTKRPAYTHGNAKMTYTDGLILQTNSRSKDAVLFTFNYSTQSIGDLENDLNCTAKGLGLDRLSLATQENANYAIDRLDHALCKATMVRSTFGSAQNRLEHKMDNLANMDEDLTEAESNIRDTDVAIEMMSFTKGQVVMNAAQSMLAQANTQKQSVLNLLGQ